jgi:hypothetical protein
VTGSYSKSEITDNEESQNAVACALGYACKARAPIGCAIVCVHRNDEGGLIHIKAAIVDGETIKANVFYTLDENGEFAEAE